MGRGPNFKGRACWTSARENTGAEMLKGNVAWQTYTIVRGGEFAFAYQHPAWVCEVHEEVGALMAKYIDTKCVEVSGTSK